MSLSLEGVVLSVTGNFDRQVLSGAVRKAGGRVDALVHKNLDYLISDDEAVKRNTQRVRKAVKMGIPIVSEKYLLARLKAGKEIDHEPYLMTAREQPKTRAAALNGRRGTGVTALRLNTHSATDEGEDETRARERGGGVGKLQGVTQGDWETEQLQEKSWEIVEGSEDRAGRAVARGGDTGHSGAEMHDVACAKDAAEGDTEDDFLNGPDRGGRGGGGKVGRGKSEGEKPDAHDRGIHTDAQDKGMQKKRPRPQWDSGLRRSLAHRLVLLPRSMRYSSA